jgi:hypothetical protein
MLSIEFGTAHRERMPVMKLELLSRAASHAVAVDEPAPVAIPRMHRPPHSRWNVPRPL